jgi:signal transduction histidine kinase
MKLILQQLQRNPNTHAAVGKSVDALLKQVEVLNGIATSFSAFAKMPEPVMEPVNLNALLESVIRLHGEAGNIQLDTETTEAVVKGDARLLSSIFSNLILNAQQAAKPNEPLRIIVRLRREEHAYRVEVEDNGTGIDEAMRDKIFLPHFTTRQSGSGLGLAIARQSIEQMGGSITFTTRTGEGTTFIVRLPTV